MGRFGFFVSVLLCLSFSGTQCLRFDLPSGQTKCIAEEIQHNVMVLGNYHVVAPGSDEHRLGTITTQPVPDDHKLTVRVTSPYGNSVHYAEKVESGQFAFTTTEVGDYLACFWIPPVQPVVKATVEIEWKTGVFAKDWTKIAKRDKIDGDHGTKFGDDRGMPVAGVSNGVDWQYTLQGPGAMPLLCSLWQYRMGLRGGATAIKTKLRHSRPHGPSWHILFFNI